MSFAPTRGATWLSVALAAALLASFGLFLAIHLPELAGKAPETGTAPIPDLSGHPVLELRDQAVRMLEQGQRAEGLARLKRLSSQLAGVDPEFDAWLGAATVMQALDARSGIEKMTLVDDGIQAIDAALRSAPDNRNCRFIRIRTLLSLPDFFADRRRAGIRELATMVDWYEQNHPAWVTDTQLRQTTSPIEGSYLAETLAWAIAQATAPADAQALETLLRRVKQHTTKAQPGLSPQEHTI